MQVSGSGSVPSHVPTIWENISSIPRATTNWVVDHFKERQSSLCKTDLWQQTAKPWYERTIQPLTVADYILLTSSVVVAVIITVIALNTLGIAMLPLATGADAVIVLGACAISRSRVHKHFNNIAWDYVNNMRNIARGITSVNQNFTQIAKNRGLLNKPEFERLSEDKKELDKNIHQFENLIKDRKDRDFVDGKSTFLKKLEALQEKLVPGRKMEDREPDKKTDPTPQKPLTVTAHDNSQVLDARKTDQVQPEPKTGVEVHIEEDKNKNPSQSSSVPNIEIHVTEEKSEKNADVEFLVKEDKKNDDPLNRSSVEVLVQEDPLKTV